LALSRAQRDVVVRIFSAGGQHRAAPRGKQEGS
jgi:hypothetical protein